MQNQTEIKKLLNEIEGFRNVVENQLYFLEENLKTKIELINSANKLIENKLLALNNLIEEEQKQEQKYTIEQIKNIFTGHYDTFNMETYADAEDLGDFDYDKTHNGYEFTFLVNHDKVSDLFNDKLRDFKEDFFDILISLQEIEKSVTDEG